MSRPAAGNRVARVGVALLTVLVTVSVAAPLLAPYDPTARVGPAFAPPSAAHLLGTNDAGQDLLSELLFGGRVSLVVGVTAAAVAVAVGTVVGLVAGTGGRAVDAVLMRLVDMVLSLPLVPLTIVVGVFLGPGLSTLIIVIAAATWAGTARELRSQVLSLRERDHVRAVKAMGAGLGYRVRHYLLPSVTSIVVPQFVLAAKTAILLEAALSFLGLGDAAQRSWGMSLSMAYDRSAFLTGAWLWWVLPFGLCIAAAVLAFALIGFGLELRGAAPVRRSAARWWVPRPPAPDATARTRGPSRPTRETSTAAREWPCPPRDALLAVEALTVEYASPDGDVRAVDDVSLRVCPGEVVGLVGESGSGKTSLAMAAVGLLRPPGQVVSGTRWLCGLDVDAASPERLRRLHGGSVALVPQDAMAALDPVIRVGEQIAEAVRTHQRISRPQARRRATELLEQVGVPGERARAWPHEFSGGMAQRAVLAMALANDPALIVADEPTHGLDVVRAAEFVALLKDLRAQRGQALLIVSHDLPLVLGLADRVAVMRGGVVVEQGTSTELAQTPRHPYTRRLIDAVPTLPAWSPAPIRSHP